MKTIKVITTVGTSLVENAKKGKYLNQVDDEYGCIKKAEYFQSWKSYFDNGTIGTVKVAIRPFFENNYADISAEIKSLVLIQQEQNCKLEVYLICTDTILSVVAADMIKEFFEGKDGQGGYDPNKEKFVIKFEHNEKFIMENDIARFISYDCDVFNVTAGDRQWAVQCAIKNAKNTICLSERQLTQFVSNSTSHYSNGCWDSWYDWS
jgi:hypothetical protein